MTSSNLSRRDFVKTAGAAGALALTASAYAKVKGANDRITMGVIGVGGMGTVAAEDFPTLVKRLQQEKPNFAKRQQMLLAERYERRSVGITTNLVFSDWTRIFQDPMTTVAAIDRVVHHAVILEFDNESVRATQAKSKASGTGGKSGA